MTVDNRMQDVARLIALLSLGLAPGVAPGPVLAQGSTFPANGYAIQPGISDDGRYVAFLSEASNLVPGDTNGRDDAFIVDRTTGAATRASLTVAGGQVNGYVYSVSLSRNGRYLAFVMDRDGTHVFDRETGTVRIASIGSNGERDFGRGTASVSNDGRYAAFWSFSQLTPGDTDSSIDVYLRDLVAETTTLVTPQAVAGGSFAPVVSADGAYIAFASDAQLLPSDTNGACDIYRWSRATQTIELVSAPTSGPPAGQAQGADCFGDVPLHDISANGNEIAFTSSSPDMVFPATSGNFNVYTRRMSPVALELSNYQPNGQRETVSRVRPRISGNGRYLTYFSSDTGSGQLSVVDRFVSPGPSRQVVVASRDFGAIASDGRAAWTVRDLAAFGGPSANAHDQVVSGAPLAAPASELVSNGRVGDAGGGQVRSIALSGNGGLVAFTSEATSLVANDTNGRADVFVRDTASGAIERVSTGPGGQQADDASYSLDISGDGRYVAFLSRASNLFAGDNATTVDLFRKDRQSGAIVKVNPNGNGLEIPNPLVSPYLRPSISADGRYVGYFATSTELGTTPEGREAFVTDLSSGITIRLSAGPGGEPADGDSFGVDVASNGRYVAFDSRSAQIVPGDTNVDLDVFVHDLQTGQRERVSTTVTGQQADPGSNGFPQISADGRYVIFQSCSPNIIGGPFGCALVRKDRQSGELVVKPTFVVVPLDLSDDGRYAIAMAANAPLPTQSSDDQFAFAEIYRFDFESADAVWVTRNSVRESPNGRAAQPEGAMSGDGERAAFVSSSDNYLPDDDNFAKDAFIVDLPTQALQIVSRPGGLPIERDLVSPALGAGGNLLVAESRNRAGVFGGGGSGGGVRAKGGVGGVGHTSIELFNRATGRNERIDLAPDGAPADGNSSEPAISDGGNRVTFTSEASNLSSTPPPQGPKPQAAVYMHNVATDTTVVMSPPFDSQPLDGPTTASAVAVEGDGDAVVVMTSAASNLLPGDSNGETDIFVAVAPAGGGAPQVQMVSAAAGGQPANAPSVDPDISPNGQFVTWSSLASNLPTGGSGDSNNDWDIYLWDRATGVTICMTNGGNGPSKKPDIISFGGGPGGGGPGGGGTGGGAAGWVAVWESRANNLVGNDRNPDSDIFLRASDGSGEIQLISRAFNTGPANGPSHSPSISPDGRFVTYTSLASNLIQGDTNNAADVFIYDRDQQITRRISQPQGVDANQFSMQAVVVTKAGEPLVAWDTAATNVDGADDGAFDIAVTLGNGPPVPVEPALFADGFE